VKLTVNAKTPKGFIVHINEPTAGREGIIVLHVVGANAEDAERSINEAGLVASFSGPMTNSEVAHQSPNGGILVQRGSTVRLQMEILNTDL
jgi:beta-lactam-binding protein with PASTA domain